MALAARVLSPTVVFQQEHAFGMDRPAVTHERPCVARFRVGNGQRLRKERLFFGSAQPDFRFRHLRRRLFG